MENKVLKLGNRLEGILRKCLNCDSVDFGVKSNDNLTTFDWRSPINFALGYKYGQSNKNPELKFKIDNFLGNVLTVKSIGAVINHYEHYAMNDEDEAYQKVENIIDELEKILSD